MAKLYRVMWETDEREFCIAECNTRREATMIGEAHVSDFPTTSYYIDEELVDYIRTPQ